MSLDSRSSGEEVRRLSDGPCFDARLFGLAEAAERLPETGLVKPTFVQLPATVVPAAPPPTTIEISARDGSRMVSGSWAGLWLHRYIGNWGVAPILLCTGSLKKYTKSLNFLKLNLFQDRLIYCWNVVYDMALFVILQIPINCLLQASS